GTDLPGNADDAAVLREQGVPRRGLVQDQARPPRPARRADRRDRVPGVRCLVADDRLGAGARRRLDRGVTARVVETHMLGTTMRALLMGILMAISSPALADD